MVEISLTDFVDFAVSVGTPKLTKVRQVMARPEYEPAMDFWKLLRDGLVRHHRSGNGDKREIDRILVSVTDAKKVTRYRDCIAGYKRFLGRKDISWQEPPGAVWGPPGITVRVNPELGLTINGQLHIVKLYFKADPLSQRRTDTVLLLMAESLRAQSAGGTRFGLLDVSRGKLYADQEPDRALLPLLVGEATSFLTIWQQLESPAA